MVESKNKHDIQRSGMLNLRTSLAFYLHEGTTSQDQNLMGYERLQLGMCNDHLNHCIWSGHTLNTHKWLFTNRYPHTCITKAA